MAVPKKVQVDEGFTVTNDETGKTYELRGYYREGSDVPSYFFSSVDTELKENQFRVPEIPEGKIVEFTDRGTAVLKSTEDDSE